MSVVAGDDESPRGRTNTIPASVRSRPSREDAAAQTALGKELTQLGLQRLIAPLVLRHGFDDMQDLVQHYQDRGMGGLKKLLLPGSGSNNDDDEGAEPCDEDMVALTKVRVTLDALVALNESKGGATTATVARRRGVSPIQSRGVSPDQAPKSPSPAPPEDYGHSTRRSGHQSASSRMLSEQSTSVYGSPSQSAINRASRKGSDLASPPGAGNLTQTRELTKQIDHYWKLVVVGAPHSGKSCFIQRVVGGTYNSEYTRTMGVDYRKWHMQYSQGETTRANIEISFWDVAGQRNGTFARTALNGANGLIFLYDCTSADSLQTTLQMRENTKGRMGMNIPCLLVGSKNDLAQTEQFPWDDATRMEAENRYAFMDSCRCSAKSGDGVMEAVERLAHLVYRQFVVEPEQQSGVAAVRPIIVKPKPIKKTGVKCSTL